MEKPVWRVRSSRYLVESPYMRLRVDEVELPNGTVVPDYYVREGAGFVSVFPLTERDTVVLVRQYRYGSDTIGLELPAGTLDRDEAPLACACRELAEETGYEAATYELAAVYRPEPVRSNAFAYVFVARDARRTREPRPDPTEHLEVEEVDVDEFRAMLRDGTIEAGSTIAAGYRALEFAGRL
ncbi:MAG TPA: NUDIX hydrolase [Candidatus Acidoferrales bacterium]|nr:NUDIX hydrolase [Candidatus Acidoferrales bacterium]